MDFCSDFIKRRLPTTLFMITTVVPISYYIIGVTLASPLPDVEFQRLVFITMAYMISIIAILSFLIFKKLDD